MAGHDLVFFLNEFIRVQSVKIRGLIIWLRLRRAVSIFYTNVAISASDFLLISGTLAFSSG